MKEYENYKLIENALEGSEYTIEDYKLVLNKLEDEQSKLVLFYRTMIDNTDDQYYGINLELVAYNNNSVTDPRDREIYNFHRFLLKNSNYKKKIYQIGIPDNRLFPRILVWQGWKPLSVECVFEEVDESYSLDATGGYIVPVKKSNEIAEYSFDEESIFIIANAEYDVFYNYLIHEKNIKEEQIFVFREDPPGEKNTQYFCESFFPITEKEIYLDCGTYDFKSIDDFLYWCRNRYRKIYAFEPIKTIYDTYSDIINEFNIENIETHNIGIWNKKEELSFYESDFGDSRVSEQGENKLPVDSIDNILNGQEATLIKLDIEGAEFEAIEGAKNTIQKYKPKLTISAYHKKNDIIRLVKKVLSYNSDYKIYARHYGHNIYETNLYFIEQEND